MRITSERTPAMTDARSLDASIKKHAGLIAFAITYLIGFSTYGIVTGARLTIAYAILVVAAAIVVAFADTRVRFSRGVLWCLAVWGVLHMAGGLIEFRNGAVLYNVSWGIPVVRYDRLVHAFGFGTTVALCWQVLRNRLHVRTVTTAVAILAWLGGMGFGAFNETIEFVISRLTETNVGGYANTGWDLIANTAGCTVVAVWLRVARSHPTDPSDA
jgi:hypothetical protein